MNAKEYGYAWTEVTLTFLKDLMQDSSASYFRGSTLGLAGVMHQRVGRFLLSQFPSFSDGTNCEFDR